jgi:hypothetical protein
MAHGPAACFGAAVGFESVEAVVECFDRIPGLVGAAAAAAAAAVAATAVHCVVEVGGARHPPADLEMDWEPDISSSVQVPSFPTLVCLPDASGVLAPSSRPARVHTVRCSCCRNRFYSFAHWNPPCSQSSRRHD